MTDPLEEVTALAEVEASAPLDALILRVVAGPDEGQEIELGSAPERILVGQSALCQLRLTDRRVSRRHLAVEVTREGLRITDLGSSNGTFVGRVRVTDVFLKPGDRVALGATTLEVGVATPTHRTPPPVSRAHHFGRLVGASPAMQLIYPLCERLAMTNLPVLIEGETGTGKEVLAEAIHEQGPRASGPFVVFDCTAVPPSLIESELFGHVRGAFTGAVASRAGVFEQAHGGTLLIDEIGDLDRALQPKLLRALERSEVRRVGSDKVTTVNVRVLSATRRDLDRQVQEGTFRDDLFHRLAGARVELPPLRRREGDVRVLLEHFMTALGASVANVPYDQMLRWESAPWPGNVRELRHAAASWVALGDMAPPSRSPVRNDSPEVWSSDFFEQLLGMPIGLARRRLLDSFERAYVGRVLAQHGGSVEDAAAASGIARRQFFRLKAKLDPDADGS